MLQLESLQPYNWRGRTEPAVTATHLDRPAVALVVARTCAVLFVLVALLGAPPLPAADRSIAELVAAQDDDGLRAYGPAVLPELARIYEASDPDGRVQVAWILYRLGWRSDEAQRVLMEDVHTQYKPLRLAAQYALGRVSNDDVVVDVLLENMRRREDKWIFRDKAACGLAYDQIHLTETQKVRLYARLIQALEDPDVVTRQLAIQVLFVHTGQNKGYDAGASVAERAVQVELWWRWLAEYRSNL